MTPPTIRPLLPDDYDQWRRLYQGYANFYQVALTPNGVQTTWSWLIDARHVCTGLVAEQSGQLVGLAHFRGMPSPLRGQMIGFLDDLFVDEHFRGQKIAQKLIKYLESLSKENNWDGIRWITHSSNETAKKLYDKIAKNTGFELYELKRD